MCFRNYIATFLSIIIFAFSLQSYASEETEYQSTETIINEILNRPLYDSVDSTFSSLHVKILGSLFGKANLIIMLDDQVPSAVIDEIKGLSHEQFESYIEPFPSALATIVLSSLLGFFFVSSVYISWNVGKYIIERAWVVTVSDKNDAGTASSGGGMQMLLRVAIAGGIIFPTLAALRELANGDANATTAANKALFSLMGNTFKTTEMISRSFVGDNGLYSPFYTVVFPDFHAEQFKEFNKFAQCVASTPSEANIELRTRFIHAKSSPDFNSKLVYGADYDNCSLRVNIQTDVKTIQLLQKNKDLAEVANITAFDYANAAQSAIKSELDSYLKTSLDAFSKLTDIYYAKGSNKSELNSSIQLDMKNWYAKCDTVTDTIRRSNKFPLLLEATQMLPFCYSKRYIQKLSYPVGEDFDLKVMDQATNAVKKEGRLVTVCDIQGGETEVSRLASCVQSKCSSINSKNAETGLFECAASIGSMAEVLDIERHTSGGFLMAPLHNNESLTFDIADSNKNYISSLRINTEITTKDEGLPPVTTHNVGDKVWSHNFDKRGEDEAGEREGFFEIYKKSLSGKDSIINLPIFVTENSRTIGELLSLSAARFQFCFANSGAMIPNQNSTCGTNYQETNRFLQSYSDMIAMAFALSAMNFKKVAAKLKDSTTSFGKVKAPSIFSDAQFKKLVLGTLTSIGLGYTTVYLSDFETLENLTRIFLHNPDPFNPSTASLIADTGGEAMLVALVGLVANSTVLSSLLLVVFKFTFIAFAVFKYIPALLFLVSMSYAFLNLIAFLASLPFQIASAYAESGSDGLRKIKQLAIKLVLTLIRFPLLVVGFYASFELFDAALPAYIFAMSKIGAQFSTDTVTAELLVYFVGTLIYGGVILTLALICLGTVNNLYDHLKGFLMNESNSSEAVNPISEAKEAMSSIK